MFPLSQPASIGRAVELGDYVRRSPLRLGESLGHKEWLHFAVSRPGLHLLVNFSFADTCRESGGDGSEEGRLIALLCDDDGWSGGVATPAGADANVIGGAIDVQFGSSRVAWRDGVFAIDLDEPDLDLVGTLRLHPITYPSVVHNFPLGSDRRMHWFTLPRLWCTGTVVAAGRVHELRGTPAYHDHNWGAFAWGGDYSWQWGFALPQTFGAPWSVVFLVMRDRHGHHADVRGVFVWRHAREKRLFRDREVRVSETGVWFPEHVHKVPGVMRLLAPGTASAVPARSVIAARGRGDELVCEFRPRALAQVIVPNDVDAGVTILNETVGQLAVEGRIDGETFAFETESVVEFLGA